MQAQKPQIGDSFHFQVVTEQNWYYQNKSVLRKETVQLFPLPHYHGHSKGYSIPRDEISNRRYTIPYVEDFLTLQKFAYKDLQSQ